MNALYTETNNKYKMYYKLFEKEKNEKVRLNALIISQKDILKYEDAIQKLKVESQELAKDLLGARGREKAYREK
jgi:hypothetical protein